VAVTGGGGGGGDGAGWVVGVVAVVGVVVGAGAGAVVELGVGTGVGVGSGVDAATDAGAGAAAAGAALAPAEVADAARRAVADPAGCDVVPREGEVAAAAPELVAVAVEPAGTDDADRAPAPACNALICCMVDEIDACRRATPDFSRAVAAAMEADCTDFS
jgi:hypothetical protein